MKFLKIFLLNFIFITIVLFCVEVHYENIIFKKYAWAMPDQVIKLGPLKFLKYHLAHEESFESQRTGFRKPNIKNSNKGSVILFGCSYTYGTWLKAEDTFSAKLSNFTQRTVYNRAFPTVAVPFMYYQLKNNYVKNDIKNAEYIVYTLTEEHLSKISTNRGWILAPELQITYDLKNGNLHRVRPLFPFIYSTYTAIAIQEKIKNDAAGKRKYELIIEKLLDESYKLAKTQYPDATIVLFVFDDKNWFGSCTNEFLNYLKHCDYKVVWLSDVLGYTMKDKKYYTKDTFHPSAEAWDLIVPKFAKKLNL